VVSITVVEWWLREEIHKGALRNLYEQAKGPSYKP
jgi:hypothetical protein